MEAPAELGVAAGLAGAARVVALVQLVAALRHGGDAQVKLETRTHAGNTSEQGGFTAGRTAGRQWRYSNIYA